MDSPLIVFLLGAGNSGSTVLGMILGAHSETVSVGEPGKYDRYRTFNMVCSCGAPIRQCAFWSCLELDESTVPVSPLTKYSDLVFRGPRTVNRDQHFRPIIQRNREFYKAVSELSGKAIVIDSSQDLIRFYYMARSGQFRIRPIFLIRDGRDYIDSMRRRMKMNAFRSVIRWCRINLATRKVIKDLGISDHTKVLRYRDLMDDRETTLSDLCDWLDISYESDMLSFHKREHHHIAGTPSRFEMGRLERPDKQLGLSEKATFTLLGGPVWNRIFGVQ